MVKIKNMKKIAVNVEFKNKNYISDYTEYNEKDEESVKDLIKSGVQGNLKHLAFRFQNKEYYFPKEIITQSIISLVYVE